MEETVVTVLQEVFSSIEERLGWSVFIKALFWAMCLLSLQNLLILSTFSAKMKATKVFFSNAHFCL